VTVLTKEQTEQDRRELLPGECPDYLDTIDALRSEIAALGDAGDQLMCIRRGDAPDPIEELDAEDALEALLIVRSS
jgi:hypothetical protein